MSDENFKGATAEEQVIEAARRNNLDLFKSIEDQYEEKPNEFIKLLNTSTDATGDSALHLCCKYGCYTVMDEIIDLDGVNLNVRAPVTGDTPLHYAANYSFSEPAYALFLIQQLIEVGANPSIRNKEGLKPIDIVGGSNDKIRKVLESAEYARTAEHVGEVVQDIDDDDNEDVSDENNNSDEGDKRKDHGSQERK